jgi:hypothetical protein
MELTRVTVEITQVLRSNLSRYQLQLLDHLVDIYRSYEHRDDTHEAMFTDESIVDRGRRIRIRRSDGGDHATTTTTTTSISLGELTTSLAVLRLSIACCEERRTLRCIVDDK